MINTNEIRLGNYYQDRGGKWLRVDFIEYIEKGYSTKFGQKMYINNEEVHPMTEYSDYANPIELTKDWLVKFGFKQENGIMSYVKEDYTDIQIVYETIAKFYRLYPRTNKIKYVHELQNLFYALTGCELD